MSHLESELAIFTLPASSFAPMRKAIQEADRARKEEVFAHTQACWKQMTRKERANSVAYREAVRRYLDAELSTTQRKRDWYGEPVNVTRRGELYNDVHAKLESATFADKPRRVLSSDMEYPTNRTTRFDGTAGDVSVTFVRDTNQVLFKTPFQNGVLARSTNSWLRKALFDQVSKVGWTRGTGGVLQQTHDVEEPDYDEYGNLPLDREPIEREVAGYGYIGAEHVPTMTSDFRNAKGQVVRVAALHRAAARTSAARGKSTPASSAGSFRSVHRGEVPLTL